ncbi:MAG: hypothetical protein WCK59_01450 [Candidatus Falkowbacteria bacterium]
MRQSKSTILYLFILLMLLAGLSLFIFKDNLAGRFLNPGDSNNVLPVKPTAGSFNLNILRDSRVKELKNYVGVFSYEDLNKSQDALEAALKAQQEVIISNPSEASSSAVYSPSNFVRVRVGNPNPFIVNKVVK